MLVLDTSALVKRYNDEAGTALVLAAMERDAEWAASVLALVEAEVALCNSGVDDDETKRQRLRIDWERFRVVPLDAASLRRASEIGCAQMVRTLDAIHLAAADRFPRPLTFLTFDRRQGMAARALGMDVIGVMEE